MKKFIAVLLTLVLAMSMGISGFAATNKKQSILDEMMAAATELGVENSATFQNAYTSVANYEGIITDEQYQAALNEIQIIKDSIASKGVDVVRQDQTLINELIQHVIAAAQAVGITIVYDGNGVGSVTFNAASGSGSGNANGDAGFSDPIKQTGLSYGATGLMVAGIVFLFVFCVYFARKKQLFV